MTAYPVRIAAHSRSDGRQNASSTSAAYSATTTPMIVTDRVLAATSRPGRYPGEYQPLVERERLADGVEHREPDDE